MIATFKKFPLRFPLWSVMLLLIPFVAWNSCMTERPLVFQLASKWGTPASVTVYATRNNAGLILTQQLFWPRLVVLKSSDMTELQVQLKSAAYRQLSTDASKNLGGDARYGCSDEDIYVLHDWVAGEKHTVECFSGECGAGQTIADWLFRKAGVKHNYKCS